MGAQLFAGFAMTGLTGKRDEKRFLEIVSDLYNSVLFPAVDNLAQCRYNINL